MKKFIAMIFCLMLAACASMEGAKNFNEQSDYVDAGLDGVVSSISSQYKAGIITRDERDKYVGMVQEALDSLKLAKTYKALDQPDNALKALEAAQLAITALQQQVEVKKP